MAEREIRSSAAAAPIRVCALVPYPVATSPSQRFRLEQWAPWLAEEDIELSFLSFADRRLVALVQQPGRTVAKARGMTAALVRRLRDVAASRSYDVVVVHRAACWVGPALFERIIVALGGKIIFDFDDAIFKLDTASVNRRFGWLKFPGKTASICRLATHVVAGNDYLRDYARLHNPAVTTIPTSIDTDLYRPIDRPNRDRRVVVGWVGSSTSQTHLESFAPMLRALEKRRDVEIRVISDRTPDLPGLRSTWRAWSSQTEIAEVGDFDIGIMPMPDDDWTRGKCAAKALQYMALGVPAVCSAVGANRELIQHGENGLLASTDDEWLASLERLIDDAAERVRLGREGRKTVERRFSMKHSAALFAGVVREVTGRGRRVSQAGRPTGIISRMNPSDPGTAIR